MPRTSSPRPGRRRASRPAARATRPATPLLGVYRRRGRRGFLVPFDADHGGPYPVPPDQRNGAFPDAVVRARLRRRGGETTAEILEVIGHLNEPGVDVQVVILRHRLREAFPARVAKAAARLSPEIPPEERARRVRFDDPPPVTIDGKTARDFDDAVAVKPLRDGGFRLYVHIADVAYYVRPDTPVDREAQERGTSVYFPERVLPMLPERLSNDLCSLVPGRDRLVQSAVLDLDSRGRLRRARYEDGIIRSAARLTYNQVEAFLAGGHPEPPLPRNVRAMLKHAEALRQVLEAHRARRGSVDLDLPEPEILLDVEGVMTGIRVEARNRAHRMIEAFMLAANEAVAGYLHRRHAPCIYRVHEAPDPEKVEILASFARTLGLEFRIRGGEVRPADLRRLMEQAEGRPEYPVLAMMMLRTLKRARYSTENLGHFALAAPVYCHFTSPIRRYPDLVVHRALRAVRRNDASALRALGRGLEDIAEQSSERERRAEAAERELLDWKKVQFMEGREGQVFEGIVVGVAPFGLFVRIPETMAEGLVRVETLGEEYFEYDAGRQELRGSRTGTRYRLGQPLTVRVVRVDRILRRLDLVPQGEARRPGGGQGREAHGRETHTAGRGRRRRTRKR